MRALPASAFGPYLIIPSHQSEGIRYSRRANRSWPERWFGTSTVQEQMCTTLAMGQYYQQRALRVLKGFATLSRFNAVFTFGLHPRQAEFGAEDWRLYQRRGISAPGSVVQEPLLAHVRVAGVSLQHFENMKQLPSSATVPLLPRLLCQSRQCPARSMPLTVAHVSLGSRNTSCPAHPHPPGDDLHDADGERSSNSETLQKYLRSKWGQTTRYRPHFFLFYFGSAHLYSCLYIPTIPGLATLSIFASLRFSIFRRGKFRSYWWKG